MCISIFRILFTIFIFVTTIFTVRLHAGEQIKLEKKFFSPIKYSYNGQPLQKVYTFTGMNAETHFKKLMSRYPESLRELKQSYIYNGVSFLGTLVVLSGAILELSNTLQEAKDVSQGKWTNNSNDTTPLSIMLAGAVITLVGSIIAHNHLKNSVRIFNKKQSQVSRIREASGIKICIKPEIIYNHTGLSLIFQWD